MVGLLSDVDDVCGYLLSARSNLLSIMQNVSAVKLKKVWHLYRDFVGYSGALRHRLQPGTWPTYGKTCGNPHAVADSKGAVGAPPLASFFSVCRLFWYKRRKICIISRLKKFSCDLKSPWCTSCSLHQIIIVQTVKLSIFFVRFDQILRIFFKSF